MKSYTMVAARDGVILRSHKVHITGTIDNEMAIVTSRTTGDLAVMSRE